MTTVIIALDDTDESHQAASTAAELFGPDATYLAVNIADSLREPANWAVYGYTFPIPLQNEEERAERTQRTIERARQLAEQWSTEANLDAVAIGDIGDPVEALLRISEHQNADALVVGTHDRSWIRDLLERSVTEELLKRSHIPVVAVPPATR